MSRASATSAASTSAAAAASSSSSYPRKEHADPVKSGKVFLSWAQRLQPEETTSAFAAGVAEEAESGNWAAVRDALTKRPEIVNQLFEGYTPTHRAAKANAAEYFRWLSGNKNVEVNWQVVSRDNMTPFEHTHCNPRPLHLVEVLVQRQCNEHKDDLPPWIVDEYGPDVVQQLLQLPFYKLAQIFQHEPESMEQKKLLQIATIHGYKHQSGRGNTLARSAAAKREAVKSKLAAAADERKLIDFFMKPTQLVLLTEKVSHPLEPGRQRAAVNALQAHRGDESLATVRVDGSKSSQQIGASRETDGTHVDKHSPPVVPGRKDAGSATSPRTNAALVRAAESALAGSPSSERGSQLLDDIAADVPKTPLRQLQAKLRDYDAALRAETERQQSLWERATAESEEAPAQWERMSANLVAWRREYLAPLLESQFLNRQMWREQVIKMTFCAGQVLSSRLHTLKTVVETVNMMCDAMEKRQTVEEQLNFPLPVQDDFFEDASTCLQADPDWVALAQFVEELEKRLRSIDERVEQVCADIEPMVGPAYATHLREAVTQFWDARMRQHHAAADAPRQANNGSSVAGVTTWDDFSNGNDSNASTPEKTQPHPDKSTSLEGPAHSVRTRNGSSGDSRTRDDAVRRLVRSLQSKSAQQRLRRKSFLGSELSEQQASAAADVQASLTMCKAVLMDSRTPIGSLIAHWLTTLTPERVPSSVPAFLSFLENVVRFDFDLGGVSVAPRDSDDDDSDDDSDGNHDGSNEIVSREAQEASRGRQERRRRKREAASLPLGAMLAAMLYSEKAVAMRCNEYADVVEKARDGDATWQKQSLWLRLGDVDTVCELPEPLMALIDVADQTSSLNLTSSAASHSHHDAGRVAGRARPQRKFRVIDKISADVAHHLKTFHDAEVPYDKVVAVLAFTKDLQQNLLWAMQQAEQRAAEARKRREQAKQGPTGSESSDQVAEPAIIHLGADAVLPATIYVLASLCQHLTHPHRAVMIAQALGVQSDPTNAVSPGGSAGGSSGAGNFGEAAYYLCSFEVALAHLNGIPCPPEYGAVFDSDPKEASSTDSSRNSKTSSSSQLKVDVIVPSIEGAPRRHLRLPCHRNSIHYVENGGDAAFGEVEEERKNSGVLGWFQKLDKNAKEKAARDRAKKAKEFEAKSKLSTTPWWQRIGIQRPQNDSSGSTSSRGGAQPENASQIALRQADTSGAEVGANGVPRHTSSGRKIQATSRSVPSGQSEILQLATQRSAQRKDARETGAAFVDAMAAQRAAQDDSDLALALRLQEELNLEAEQERRAAEDRDLALAMQVRDELNRAEHDRQHRQQAPTASTASSSPLLPRQQANAVPALPYVDDVHGPTSARRAAVRSPPVASMPAAALEAQHDQSWQPPPPPDDGALSQPTLTLTADQQEFLDSLPQDIRAELLADPAALAGMLRTPAHEEQPRSELGDRHASEGDYVLVDPPPPSDHGDGTGVPPPLVYHNETRFRAPELREGNFGSQTPPPSYEEARRQSMSLTQSDSTEPTLVHAGDEQNVATNKNERQEAGDSGHSALTEDPFHCHTGAVVELPPQLFADLDIDWKSVAGFCLTHFGARVHMDANAGKLAIRGEPKTVLATKKHIDGILQKAFMHNARATIVGDCSSVTGEPTHSSSNDPSSTQLLPDAIRTHSDDDSVQLDDIVGNSGDEISPDQVMLLE